MKSPWRWFVFALLVRTISSYTHASFGHPDEWFKTVEFARYFTHGFATYCQEVGLHYTNLSWPFLLTIPLSLAKWISDDSLTLRVFSFQFFTGLLDLGIFWGWYVAVQSLNLSPKLKNIALAVLVLPWFFVHDSIRPTSEHLSVIFAWVSLGFLLRRQLLVAGILAVGIFAMRCPSALISLGYLVAVIWQDEKPKFRDTRRFILGCVLGLVLFGIPDWLIYGRPWESFWIYLQYNIFTGLSRTVFGKQSPDIYLAFWSWRWLRLLLPFGIISTVTGAYGLYLGLRRKLPWALGLFFFVLGHILVAHKESRFISPAETFWLWAAFYGALEIWQKYGKQFPIWALRAGRVVLVYVLVINAALFLKELWGETLTGNKTYLDLPAHFREVPRTCAVVSSRRKMTSILYPNLDRGIGEGVPSPALGLVDARTHEPSFPEAALQPILWIEHAPRCEAGDRVLLHTWTPDERWEAHGCSLLRSGLLRWIPESYAQTALKNHWVSGPWYNCPPEIFRLFKAQHDEKVLFHGFTRHEHFPRYGISGDELLQFDRDDSPAKPCRWICPG